MFLVTSFSLFLIFGVLPTGTILLRLIENHIELQQLPNDVVGIIVLGGSTNEALSTENNTYTLNDSAERLLAFAELSYRYPNAQKLFTGGSGRLIKGSVKEADIASRALSAVAMNVDDVKFESQSRNTHENALFSMKYRDVKKEGAWVLITSAYHMPRAMGVFQKAGWKDVIPYPVDYRVSKKSLLNSYSVLGNFQNSTIVLKEIIGSIVYYLTGKTASLIP